MLGTIALSLVVFINIIWSHGLPLPAMYVLLLLFVWAALRRTAFEATNVVLAASLIAIWGTTLGLGPALTQAGTPADHVLSLQAFLAVAAIVTLFLAVEATERRRSELAVREQEAHLRSIFETVPDAVITIDEHGIVESYSKAAARLFGYDEAEIVGRNVSMLMPPYYRERHDGYIARYLATGERRIIGIGRVVVGQRKDGTTFPMELAIGELRTNRRRSFTGFVRDISERQQTERRLQDLHSELIHVARVSAMGQMASALAHELNQPLTAVANYLQAGRRMLQAGDERGPQRAAEMMEKAAGQATRAGQIIRRLREFLAKGRTERTAENVNRVVEEAVALAQVGTRELGAKISFDFAEDLPQILIDRIQIQQVVLNLVRNAVEAMAQSSRREITITTARSGGEEVEIAVADSGPGIADEIAAQLFQPFVTTKEKGMGVGLSISRSIVEGHGGRLWASTNDGGGVTFHFTVSAAPSPPRDGEQHGA
ncbi:MAG: PAS domain S-box protein [Proteobacteria bacterium]|nr:PAS domain S-box protein [Pseudomonadota bacterium]